MFYLHIPLHSCITPGGWMVTQYDVIFTVGMGESSHSLQSSRELVQITKVSVQIYTLLERQSQNPHQIDMFLSKLENKISVFSK